MDEPTKRRLRAIARELLDMCDGESVSYIHINVDKEDAMPYMCVHVYGAGSSDATYRWHEFPNDKE